MKKLILIFALLISALTFAQVTTSKVQKYVGITSVQRDALTIAANEFPVIYNTTTAQYERYNGVSWETWSVDSSELNNLSDVVTWANVPDANITESSVTQHEGALSVTESQISDLQSYITGYTVTELDVTNHEAAISITESQISDLGTYSTDIHSNISALNNVSGTNTGDQTISLTGDVTGSGTGSFTTTIAIDAVDIPMLSATGTADGTTFLRGDGTWAAPSGSGTVTTFGTPVTNDFARFTDATTIQGRSYSEVRSDLSLEVGVDVQQYDAALDLVSGTNTGDQTDISDFTGTKANFNTALTDGSFAFLGNTQTFTGVNSFGDVLPSSSGGSDLGSESFQWDNAISRRFATNTTLGEYWIIDSPAGTEDLSFQLSATANAAISPLYKLNDSGVPTDATDLVDKGYGDANYNGGDGGDVTINGSTSGTATITAPSVAGTPTLTLPTTTGTLALTSDLVHTGDVTGDGLLSISASVVGSTNIIDGTIIAGDIAAEAITEPKLNMFNSPTDGQVLGYDSVNGMQWQTDAGGGDIYLHPQSDVAIDSIYVGTTAQIAARPLGTDVLAFATDAIDEDVYVIPLTSNGGDVATATNLVPFFQTRDITITDLMISVNVAGTTSVITVDINNDGTSILTNKLTIDATEKTSATAATAYSFVTPGTTNLISSGEELSFDIDTADSGDTGAHLTLYITYTVD